MPRRLGRPTDDPKSRTIVVRLSARHYAMLAARVKADGVGISEALRRLLDEGRVAPEAVVNPRAAPKARARAKPPVRSRKGDA